MSRSLSSLELRSVLRDVVSAARVIHDGARGGRLTRQQQLDYDSLMARAGDLESQIRTAEAAERTPSGGAPLWSRNGAALADSNPRLLRPSESVFSYMRQQGAWNDAPTDLRLDRLVSAAVTGDWSHARNEHEYMATMSGGSLTGGGFAVPAPLAAQVIDRIRAQAVMLRAGAMTVPMESNTLTLARVTGDPTAVWHTENSTETASDMTLGALTLHARTLACLIKSSVELLEDATGLDDAAMTGLSAALALELDRACLIGSGAGAEPLGLANIPGVTQTSIGTVITTDNLLDALARLWATDVEANGLLWAPATRGAFEKLVDGNGMYLSNNLPAVLRDLPKLTSSQIPATTLFLGDFSDCLVGIRTNLTLEVSREAGDATGGAFSALQVWIRGYLRADFTIRHEASVQTLSDLV